MYNLVGFYKLYIWLGKNVVLFNIKAITAANITETSSQTVINCERGESVELTVHQKRENTPIHDTLDKPSQGKTPVHILETI